MTQNKNTMLGTFGNAIVNRCRSTGSQRQRENQYLFTDFPGLPIDFYCAGIYNICGKTPYAGFSPGGGFRKGVFWRRIGLLCGYGAYEGMPEYGRQKVF